MDELVLEVTQESDGGFVAECLTESIFTQANDWEELRQNVKEAVAAYYFDQPERRPRIRFTVQCRCLPASPATGLLTPWVTKSMNQPRSSNRNDS